MTDKNTQLTVSILKDRSNGARRIIQKPGVLEPLGTKHLETLLQGFENYTPNTAGGRANREAVIDILVRRKEVIDRLDTGAEAPVRKKDNLDRSRMMSEHTAVLFIKVTQPGLRACIDPEEFIAKERGEEVEAEQTDEEVDQAAQVDPKRHVVMQKLFGKDFVNPLFMNRLAFMSWLKQRCVPSTFLAGDHLLIPRVLMGEVTDKIDELIQQRNILLNEFEARYEEAKADSKLRLGVHYDEARYPAFKELREKFKVNFMWRTLDVPSSLKDISKAHYAREKAKARIEWENTFEVVRDGLRAGFQELVGGFAVALGAGDDGKPRVF
jgi:hypothetical protein